MTALAELQAALRLYKTAEFDALAAAAGIARKLVIRARKHQAINASAHLKLCAAIGIDPVGNLPVEPTTIGDMHRASLSAAVRIARYSAGQTLRQFAKAASTTHTTVVRIERGEDVSIDTILAVCTYLNRHPHDFCGPPAGQTSRETVTVPSATPANL